MPANYIVRRTRAALAILEHAERVGLPLPFDVDFTDYRDSISMIFHTLADLTDWALWLESPITEKAVGDNTHHVVEGTALDGVVRLTVVAPADVTAGADR